MDNVAYHSHTRERNSDIITAHNTINACVVTTKNKAYEATSVPTSSNQLTAAKDIYTTTNMAYSSISDIGMSVNSAYHCVQNNSNNTQEYI